VAALAVVAACLSLGAVERVEACSCVQVPVAVNEPMGRVFFIEGDGRVEPLPGMTVELRQRGRSDIVSETTTDSLGAFHLGTVRPFHLGTVRPGTYDLTASLSGFSTARVLLELRKRSRQPPRGVAIRIEIVSDCWCTGACATEPEKGVIGPGCLQPRAR
jgi:hypothetical protein